MVIYPAAVESQATWAARFEKADIIGPLRRVQKLSTYLNQTRYSVRSGQTSTRYYVLVEGDTYRCTCPAGMADRPCWHVAKVIRYRESRQDTPPAPQTVEEIVAELYG